jgi:CheY-like chemotaxis protein
MPTADPEPVPTLSEKYPLKILLAEDNPINQQLAALILTKMGYEPVTAVNGKEALDLLHEMEFDLVLMDINMPEMDGLEATRIIRATLASQPVIIAITANATPKDREECLSKGMNAFLSKPFHLHELVSLLEYWGQWIHCPLSRPGI